MQADLLLVLVALLDSVCLEEKASLENKDLRSNAASSLYLSLSISLCVSLEA